MRQLVQAGEWVAPGWLEAYALARWCRPEKTPGRWGALGETGRRFGMEVGGARLAAWEWGVDGERGTALLVHGWSSQAAHLRALVKPLVSGGYHVVAVDLPAHGSSPGHFATLVSLAQSLGEVSARLRPRVVIAHSLGATASTHAVVEGWRPQKLVLLAPPVEMPPYLRQFAQAVGLSEVMVGRLLARVESLTGRKMGDFDLRLCAPKLGEVETLVVHDAGDEVVPLASSEQLVKAWPGARLWVTQGLSHYRMCRAPQVAEAVMRFAVPEAVNPRVSQQEVEGRAAESIGGLAGMRSPMPLRR